MPFAVILPEQGFEAGAGCFEDMVVADNGARGHVLNTIGLYGRPLTYLIAMRIAGIGELCCHWLFWQARGLRDVKTTPEVGPSEW